MTDSSNSNRWERAQRVLQAPQKRDEDFDSGDKRKQRAYEPVSVRAFRLDTSSDCDERSTSGENSSPGSERQQAMQEMRGQWAAFTQRIMDVQIPSKVNPRAI